MPDSNNKGGCLGLIVISLVIPLVIAIVTSSSLPWWWNELLNFISPGPPPYTPLRTGYYDAEGTAFNGSSRYIATVQGRSCIALIEGQPTPDAGAIRLTVSPLSWRNNSFHIDANGAGLIIYDGNDSFREGVDDKSIPLWKFQQEEISEPYWSEINECLGSSEYKPTRKILNFSNGTSPNSSHLNSPAANVPSSLPTVLRVQDFPDGDYFFASEQPPINNGDVFIFRKQGNIVIGFGAEYPSDGSCLKQDILSDSQVRTEEITQYPDDTGEVQTDREIYTDDGSFWSPKLSQFNVEEYANFAEDIQRCTDIFSN